MKTTIKMILLLLVMNVQSQSLPMDFETTPETSDFINFDGGVATVIENPLIDSVNPSGMVARIVRDGGAVFAGSKLILDDNLDFTVNYAIRMKVYTSAPAGTQVKFKLEGSGSTEVDVFTTTSGEWETLVWDFTGTASSFNELVFMFDFGNVGDGSENSTFYFDDIVQFDPSGGLDQMDLPVTFDDPDVFYELTSFEGNQSDIVEDPENTNNTVGMIIKPITAGASAGTTIGGSNGFVSNVPFSTSNTKMYVRVWSPDANIPVRLKVEDSSDPTHTVETESNTTLSNAWEILEFDFSNEAPGTATLSFGLDMGWTYNMASIFFNFGTDGAAAGEKIYYFDNVSFDEPLSVNQFDVLPLQVYPNPARDQWFLSAVHHIDTIQLFDISGKLLFTKQVISRFFTLDASHLSTGLYVLHATTLEGSRQIIKLYKQ